MYDKWYSLKFTFAILCSSVKSGVKQGCMAAPDLFNCIIDHLLTQVHQRITGVILGNYHLTDLEYADDTTLFSNTVADLVADLSIFQEEASTFGLQVSWDKRKLMDVGDGADPPSIVIGSLPLILWTPSITSDH